MTLHEDFRRIAATTAAALVMTLGAGTALAQPGPGMHGAAMGAGPGAAEEMIGHLIERAKAQLNLNTSQQGMFDAAVAQSKTARTSLVALHKTVKDAMTAELAKPEPDLAAVAAVADKAQSDGLTLRHQVRASWLALYATFSPEQKAVVKTMLQNRLAHAESFAQRMRQHFLDMHGGSGG